MSYSIPVNLIRQWHYCPRIVYYIELTNYQAVYPTWVRQGEDFHAVEEQLWKRRNLSRFNLQTGKRYYNLAMSDTELAMHGIADMAIETEKAVYAAEFKLSANNKKRGDILQLTAYAMLLEQHFNKPCPAGFLLGKGKVLHTINMDGARKQEVIKTVTQIQNMVTRGVKPNSNATATQCCNCEYLNHCNDRL